MQKISRIVKSYGIFKAILFGFRTVRYFIFKKILKKKFIITNIYGSRMILDLENDGISKTLWVIREREVLDVEIVRSEVRKGMTILEAGANIGYYLLIESDILKNTGKIYAFEPDPRNLKILKKNIVLNKLKNVDLFPMGVSNENAIKKFFISKKSNLNTFSENGHKQEDFIEVKTIRIDGFEKIKNPIDFIRMDIEGYEYEAVEGMLETLKKNLNTKMLIELHPRFYSKSRDFSKTVEKLFAIGYYPKYIVSAGFYPRKEITELGYSPIKVSYGVRLSHGLYENIKEEDFIKLIKSPGKVIRSVLFSKK